MGRAIKWQFVQLYAGYYKMTSPYTGCDFIVRVVGSGQWMGVHSCDSTVISVRETRSEAMQDVIEHDQVIRQEAFSA